MIDAVARARSVDGSVDQTGLPEHLEMLRDGRLRQRHRFDQVAADAGAATGEQPENPEPRRMGQRLEDLGQSIVDVDRLVHAYTNRPDY